MQTAQCLGVPQSALGSSGARAVSRGAAEILALNSCNRNLHLSFSNSLQHNLGLKFDYLGMRKSELKAQGKLLLLVLLLKSKNVQAYSWKKPE